MPFVTLGTPSHASTTGQSATDHHTATVAGDLNLADLAARAHADLSDSPADAHHDAAHTVLSHSDGADACKVATGVYTGDGALSQAITGIGFTVLYVAVWVRQNAAGGEDFWFTTDLMVDNNVSGLAIKIASPAASDNNTEVNRIIETGTDGFTVDDAAVDANPNTNGSVYEFIALGIEV